MRVVGLPNNVTITYIYDSLNRVTNIVSKSTNGTSRTNVWIYDPLYRLTNETITAFSGGTVSYKYDGVGNRTNRTSTLGGVTNQTFVFNSNDQPTNDVFDSNGNTFSYDVENHLTNAVVSGTNIVIIYDGDGNRVKKIVGTTTNLFLVDDHNLTGYAQVLEEKTISGGTTNLTRLYTYGLDLISQRDAATTVQNYYGYDGNGNTRYLTATNATVTDTYAYDAFGNSITNTGATANFYRYSGEQYDPNLGFVYLRARYLNPNSGRFMSRDSLAGSALDPKSLHRYLYCSNDPVNCTDPTGHDDLVTFLISSSIRATLVAINVGRVAVLTVARSRVIATLVSTAVAFNAQIRAAFLNGTADKIVLEADLLVYRVFDKIGGATAGSQTASGIGSGYFTTTVITSSAQAQRLLSLDPNFNCANFIASAIIPRGTTIYQGTTAPLFGNPGGAVQIFVEDISEVAFFGIRNLSSQ